METTMTAGMQKAAAELQQNGWEVFTSPDTGHLVARKTGEFSNRFIDLHDHRSTSGLTGTAAENTYRSIMEAAK